MKHRQPVPLRITLLLCLVLITTAWNVVRLWTSIAWRVPLETYARYPGPLYVGLTGIAWAAAGLTVLWAIWRRRHWSTQALIAAALAYAAWVWLDRLVVQSQRAANWPFALIATIVLLAFVVTTALDPRLRAYFGREAHERQIQGRSSA